MELVTQTYYSYDDALDETHTHSYDDASRHEMRRRALGSLVESLGFPVEHTNVLTAESAEVASIIFDLAENFLSGRSLTHLDREAFSSELRKRIPTLADCDLPELQRDIAAGKTASSRDLTRYPAATWSHGDGLESVQLTEGQMPSHDHPVRETPHTHDYLGHLTVLQFHGTDDGTTANHDDGTTLKTGTQTNAGGGANTVQVLPNGSGDAIENRPPWYALLYIMKL